MKDWQNDPRIDEDLWLEYIENEVSNSMKSDLQRILEHQPDQLRRVGRLRSVRGTIRYAMENSAEISSDFTERVMAEVDRLELQARKSRRDVTRFWRTHLGSAAMVAGVFGLIFVNVVSVISSDRLQRSAPGRDAFSLPLLSSGPRSSIFGESRDSVFADSALTAPGLYDSVLVSRGSQSDEIKMAINWRRLKMRQ